MTDCGFSNGKGAKLREKPVDRILIERTELFDTGATGCDLPCGDEWVLSDNPTDFFHLNALSHPP